MVENHEEVINEEVAMEDEDLPPSNDQDNGEFLTFEKVCIYVCKKINFSSCSFLFSIS